MTRQVVLDTETTGLEVERGHRVIEIGCVELVDRRPSGRTFQRYLNPERTVGAGAVAVHGITDQFLADKPRFAEVAAEFLAFIDGAEILIHNAAFDTGFLDSELQRADPTLGRVADHATVVDTLALARQKYPGQKIRWMRCASALALTTVIAKSMAPCWMRTFWPTCGSR